jgi:glycosyltransferase involved in cell wall biosynthesis
MTAPSISIITPCFNSVKFIREAIESVLTQNPTGGFEHIIVDGGSTDGTLSVLEEYSHLRVISEPDQGMYDALNKGLRMVGGEIIGLLNADDVYAPNSFRAALDAFSQNLGAEVIDGGFMVFEDSDGKRCFIRNSPSIAPDDFWQRIVIGSTAPNSWFFRRKIFERAGGFDSQYRYSADREFIMRLALIGTRPVSIPDTVYYFRSHKDSATFSGEDSREPQRGNLRIKTLLEGQNIQEQYLSKKNLPVEMERFLRQAHADTSYRLSATALYHCQWKQFGMAAWRGWRHNVFWPLIFLAMSARRLRKEMTGHE